MTLRMMIAFAALAACRKEAPVTDRAQVVAPEAAVVTPIAPVIDGGAAPPVGPPPGDDKLVNVPAAIASKIELVEVARDLARPVALVAAPGDPRKRLFVVEQHVGRIRILEGGKLAAKPFFTIDTKL